MAKVQVGEVFKMEDHTVEEMKGAVLKVINSMWRSVLYINFIDGDVWWASDNVKWGVKWDEEGNMVIKFYKGHTHWLGTEDVVEVLAVDVMPGEIESLSGTAKEALTRHFV
ncbi:hypothetical protein MWV29_001617 [Escherichia coli]|nr:hypothetical protein [Escherichia coli]